MDARSAHVNASLAMHDPGSHEPPSLAESTELAWSLGLVELPAGAVPPSRAALVAVVAGQIDRWLRSDRARLGHALYRIDVPEREVERVVATTDPADTAAAIAELVVARVEQKIARRAANEARLRGK
jgi:hypothetical protein